MQLWLFCPMEERNRQTGEEEELRKEGKLKKMGRWSRACMQQEVGTPQHTGSSTLLSPK